MKTLALNQMEALEGGGQCETRAAACAIGILGGAVLMTSGLGVIVGILGGQAALAGVGYCYDSIANYCNKK